MEEDFTCSSPDLSRDTVNESVWTLHPEDDAHLDSVKTIAAFQIIYLIVGIPWNLLVIGVIVVNKLFSKPAHMLLLNLALSDLLVCVCVMPFNILGALSGRFFLGTSDYARCQICHFYVITIVVMLYASLFIVALMAVDRLIYIKFPLRYQTIMTIRMTLIVLVAIWIICILVGIPPVFGLGEISFSNIVGSCSLVFSAETTVGPSAFYIILLVLVALFPFFTTVIANVWLLCVALKSLRQNFTRRMTTTLNLPPVAGPPALEHAKSVQKIKSKYNQQQVRLAKVFGAIFIVNCITWIPIVVISLVSGAIGPSEVPPEAYSVVFLSFLSQPAIHPILETFLVAKVRNSLMKFVCFWRRKQRPVYALKLQNNVGVKDSRAFASTTSIATNATTV